MARWLKWLVAALCVAVVVGVIYFPILRRRLERTARLREQSVEQARRQLTQPIPVNPGEPRVKAKLFWASGNGDGTLTDATVELPLSSDPVLRAKQVLNTLLAGPVDAELRTLPPDAVLLAFYLVPDGTAVADFSEALATETPSGIQSEQMAIDSITRTLAADVPSVQRLKILIHGQEMETLAGHLDLTGTFLVSANGTPVPLGAQLAAPVSSPSSSPGTSPASGKAAVPAAKPGAATLTPDKQPGKLAQPEKKPQ
ncbi:MAG: GerMN domain-containing protein [Candidatus Acidiferrum sp.]